MTESAGRACYHGRMNVIYADVLFALSVFTDYLLCLVTARFCSLKLRRGRFRLLSCGSVAGSTLLAAFRPDTVRVDGKERDDLLCAVSEAAKGDGFEGIV